MLDNNIMQEAPKTIDYNEEIAIEQLKENLGLMEMKKASIIEIKNEYKDIDEKIADFPEKWMKRIEADKAEGSTITKYNEFLKEIGGDKIKDRKELLSKLLNDEKLRYHLYKRNFEYFLDYYVQNIVHSTIVKYNGKKVGAKTKEKITELFNEQFRNSGFGLYLEQNTETKGFRLFSYIDGKEKIGSRLFYVYVMDIEMSYHIFDKKNEVIDCENDWFNVNHDVNHELYYAGDIEKLAKVIKEIYKEMQNELFAFNINRDAFNTFASGVCEYIREPQRLYDSMVFSD